MTLRAGAIAALLTAAAGAAAAGLAGCGDDDRAALTDTQRTASPTLSQAPSQTPTTTSDTAGQAGAPTTPPPAATGTVTERSGGVVAPEQQEGGAGDETAARSVVSLAVSSAAVRPRAMRVPAFLGITLKLRSADGAAHSVRVATVVGQFAVPASGTATRQLDGLQPGTYGVLVDGRSTGAVIRVGDTG